MQNDAMTEVNGQHTQVGPDPLDYVLRYAPGDYDCYHQGRYIGSRATLDEAIAAVEEQQAKALRHPLHTDATAAVIVASQQALQVSTSRLRELAAQLASHSPDRAHLTLAQIRIAAAIRNLQEAERSLRLAQRRVESPLDAAA
jgi:hypothetical protein